jgi:hypothetical protein
MTSRDYRKPGGLILLIVFMLACISPLSGASTPIPLPEAKMRQTLDAALIKTAAAAQTQTATLRTPTFTPTSTHTPSKTPTHLTGTPTFLYSLPTYTASPTATATPDIYATVITRDQIKLPDGTQVDGPTSCLDTCIKNSGPSCNGFCRKNCWETCQWRCYIRSSPHPVVPPGRRFTATWTVANIGSAAWTSQAVDFVYRGGLHHDGLNIADIRATVSTGRLITIGATFIAPNKPGEYNSFYVIKVDATKTTEFCPLSMTFEVRP